MDAIASFSVAKRTMPTDSQTMKTYIYQVSRELWKKKIKSKKKKFSRQVAAILIIGEKLKI